MFKPIEGGTPAPVISIAVDGVAVPARGGLSVALALLEAGVPAFRRTPVSGEPRSPLCLMGVCFDCLVQVDGRRNVQACMVEVREGMQVRLQLGA